MVPLSRILVRDTAVPSDPVTTDVMAGAVLQLFAEQADRLLVAVVTLSGRPIGLIDRNSFMMRMSTQYGHALYAKRSVALLMDPHPLVVEGSREIGDVTSDALATTAADLTRGFIVVENGIYFGVSASLDLFRWIHARSLEIAGQAERERIFVERVIDNIPVMLFVKSAADDRFVLINRAAEDNLGYHRDELLGRTAKDVFPRDQALNFDQYDVETLQTGRMHVLQDDTIRRKSGEERSLSTRKLSVPDENGSPRWLVRVSEDITEGKRAQARIEQLAHCDALTGLANRVLFQTLHVASINASRASGTSSAILCVDLDRFKAVNDTLGHAAGDELLRNVADRLGHCIRKGDSIARLGGDEFAVVQSGVINAADVRALAERIVAAIAAPYRIDGHLVEIGASVGFSIYPQDGADADIVLRRADMALYRAKAAGRGRYEAFIPAMDAAATERRKLESELAQALELGQFRLHYQPIICLQSRRIGAFEALVRWQHPERGLILPGDFIGVAEETAQILPLGRQVLDLACLAAVALPPPVGICVNLSALQFRDPNLIGTIASCLGRTGLAPTRLEVEITEGVLLRDEIALGLLHQIKSLGCRVTLDNFGTGTASLNNLRRFPFDKIKIDRAFVKDLPSDRSSAAIVRAVTGMARALDTISVAEGVETEAQLQAVLNAGCDQAQGYLLGRPSPSPALDLVPEPLDA